MSLGHITGVGHTGMPVSEVHAASGEMFEQITEVDGCVIDICFVTAPNHTIELLRYSRPQSKTTSTLRPCDNGHIHLCFDVDDIAAVIAAGRGYGFHPVNAVQIVPDGPLAGTKVVYTKGPDNLTLELMEHPQ